MGICEAVGCLTQAVAARYTDRNGWHNLLIHILCAASVYRDAGRLDAWDEAFMRVRGDHDASSPLVRLLDAIAELGTYNVYGAIDPVGTLEEYDRLVKLLETHGVVAPALADLSTW